MDASHEWGQLDGNISEGSPRPDSPAQSSAEEGGSGPSIQERAVELAQANRQLSAALAEMEAFTYSVSHDLRGPLRAINGFSQALLEDYGADLDETGQDYLRRIQAASQRLSSLMDDLLALSRLGKEAVDREKVSLDGLAHEVMAELQAEGGTPEPEFIVQPSLDAWADPELIRLMLVNLLGNACKFTSRTPEPLIEVGRSTHDPDTFFVRDNGVGFDPTYAHKLFLPFQRLHPRQEFEGNGVGLATVRRIVEKHDGQVRAEGKPGEGATIYFSLAPQRDS
jgi:signal transduction histidine kinase